MRIPAAFALICLALSGCQSSQSTEAKAATPAAEVCRPVASLEEYAITLARQLVASNRGIGVLAPVAVTSLVTMGDLRSVDANGRLLSELLAAELQRAGWKVIDFKLTGQIDVSPQGDLALSRDYRRLPRSLGVSYLVTGVMEPGPNGWSTVVRAVSITDRTVVASGSAIVPFASYPLYGQATDGQKVSRSGPGGALERQSTVDCVAAVSVTNGQGG